jgi:preprotein translocase subunit SecG
MTAFIIAIHVLACIALVGIVLLQHGKGADIGSTFGGGASQTVFGSRGAGNFLTKLTTGFAVVFMLTSLTLSYFTAPTGVVTGLEEEAIVPAPEEAPAPAGTGALPLPGEETEPAGDAPPSGFEEIPAPSGEAEAGEASGSER